jgi:TusA-related sulfurtransferase
MSATVTRLLDLRDLPEGVQVATAGVAMLELRPGELLEVLTHDPNAPRDFSVWCRATGHRLVGHDERGGVHHFVIERELKIVDPRDTGRSDRLALPPAPAVFGEAELEGLPAPVQRYLRAAIAPGTPLATSAWLRMRGHIKVGRWVPFHARQLLAPRYGFEWTARAGGVLTGFDRYVDGVGQMCWKLLGLLPVVRAQGPDVTRSAAGRAGAEAIWLPTTLLPRFGIRWTALDDNHLAASCDVDAVEIQAHYSVDADGRLKSMVFNRWGDPERSGSWGQHPFGGEIIASTTFEGLTIPSAGRFGWFFGTDRWSDGEFFRYQITELHLSV